MALQHDKDGFLLGKNNQDLLDTIHDNTEQILAHVSTSIPKASSSSHPSKVNKLNVALKISPVKPSIKHNRTPKSLSHGIRNRDANGRFIGSGSVDKQTEFNIKSHKAKIEQIKLLKRMANQQSKNNHANNSYTPATNALLGKGLTSAAIDFATGGTVKFMGGAGRRISGASRGAGGLIKGAGKLLRRIPVLSTLMGIGTAAFAANAIDNDSSLNPDQKGQSKAATWGKAGGGLAGAALGTALIPIPVLGTLIGGIVGGIGGEAIGSTVGEWLYKRDWRDTWDTVRDNVSLAFDNTTRSISSYAQTAFDKFQATFPSIAANIEAMAKMVQAANDAFAGNPVKGSNPDGSQTIAQRIGTAAGSTANYLTGATKDSLSSFIGKGEGDYNSVNLGRAHGYKASKRNLTGMSLAAVLAGQTSREYNAVGKYQIIRDTMPEVVKGLQLTGKETFDERLQDQMGAWLAFHKRKSLGGFLSGRHNNINAAGDDAAREWASLPVFSDSLTTGKYHSKRGSTAYSDGVNKASHRVKDTQNALLAAKATYQAAIQSGKNRREAEYLAFTGLSNTIAQPNPTQTALGKVGGSASAIGSELAGYLDNIKKVGVQCVDLVKAATGVTGSTQKWQRGQAAEHGTLKQGDALATFLSGDKKKDYNTYTLSDKYGGGTGGAMGWNKDHAVIFDKYNYDKSGKIESMSVFEQYKGTNGKVVPNTYKFGTGVNNEKNASMYYGVNVAGKALKAQYDNASKEPPHVYGRVNLAELNKISYPAGGVGQVQLSTPSIAHISSPTIPTPKPKLTVQPISIPTIAAPSSKSAQTAPSTNDNMQTPYIAQKPLAQRVNHERIAWAVSGGIGLG